jgi:3-oxoacyl-[acyl-carrier-protein] synthase I
MTFSVSSIPPVAVTAYTALSDCGLGKHTLLHALQHNQSFLKPLNLFKVNFPTVVGEIRQPLDKIRSELELYQSRNAQVALTALNYQPDGVRSAVEAAKMRYGADRIGVVIGTSTSGLYETEAAYAYLLQHEEMPDDFHFLSRHAYQATGRFLQLELGLTGVCFAVSTACSSGAKAIAAGKRLIAGGVCDAVLVGGVDTLCRLTLRGFSSLELIAATACTPMDKNRNGINIGEAAGLLLLEKVTAENQHCAQLLAVGESSDAYHMSHPHPEGAGAVLAMQKALSFAGLNPEQVDYLNLHATATKINDAVEAKAVYTVFGDRVPCSGTKGITGHTLGAAGALETIIALLAIENKLIPANTGFTQADADCRCQIVSEPRLQQPLKIAMSNSFGFGGNNASLIVAASDHATNLKTPASTAKLVYLKSAVICCPDTPLLKPFGLESVEVDKTLLPAALRRRTSLTTRMAVTAATSACQQAQINPAGLASVFASLGGEMQVTDALCRLLPDSDALLSPTQFHNSVHNTTSGYWGILHQCQAPSTAIAALEDSFAMGLVEAWTQLQTRQDDILLVCYDEEWAQYLAPPLGKTAFACALVLSRHNSGGLPVIPCPRPSQRALTDFECLADFDTPSWINLAKQAPAAATISLLYAVKNGRKGLIPLNTQGQVWEIEL